MKNVLYVDKPAGITSFDVCFALRKVLGTRKIGHTGTLDPLATGVMIILFDKATKANQFLVSDTKEYETRIRLGIETDTLDTDGRIIKESPYVLPDESLLKEVLASFKGRSLQEVPITSAVSVEGKRLYQYQREGKEIKLPEREIEVKEIELLQMYPDGFSYRARVSSGTYIRALSRDILKKLNLTGCVSQLRRTAIDEIRVEDCDELSDIEKGNYHLHDLKELLEKRYQSVEYDDIKDVYNGKRIKCDSDEDRILIVHDDEAVAVYEKDGSEYKCLRGLW